MYYDIYELIAQYIYNNLLTNDAELICTLVSTCVCLSFIALPFYIVYRIVRFII